MSFVLPENALFLAPMQDVTDLGFMGTIDSLGAPDFFCAEYFRIYPTYDLGGAPMQVLSSDSLSKPVTAQFIGEDEFHTKRAILELKQKLPNLEVLDLNLGCPAPKIYRKNVGGGLLKTPDKIKSLLTVMRENWDKTLSVKMRVGFEDSSNFDTLFKTVLSCKPDFVTIHARTVKQLYRGVPDYSFIKRAVEMSNGVPVIANGDISSVQKAIFVMQETKCAGVMIGRPAVRNPWIFKQIREALSGSEVSRPKLSDVRAYIQTLTDNITLRADKVRNADSRLKKFLNFVATGVDSEGNFLREMRLALGLDNLLKVCDKHLIDNGNSEKLFALDSYVGLCARPNHES